MAGGTPLARVVRCKPATMGYRVAMEFASLLAA